MEYEISINRLAPFFKPRTIQGNLKNLFNKSVCLGEYNLGVNGIRPIPEPGFSGVSREQEAMYHVRQILLRKKTEQKRKKKAAYQTVYEGGSCSGCAGGSGLDG